MVFRFVPLFASYSDNKISHVSIPDLQIECWRMGHNLHTWFPIFLTVFLMFLAVTNTYFCSENMETHDLHLCLASPCFRKGGHLQDSPPDLKRLNQHRMVRALHLHGLDEYCPGRSLFYILCDHPHFHWPTLLSDMLMALIKVLLFFYSQTLIRLSRSFLSAFDLGNIL